MVFHNLLIGRIARNVCTQIFSQVRQNGNWHLEHLRERTVLKLKGEKCSEFLQGLITNDINLLNSQKALYAMFLNTKGRILYDSIIYKTNCNDTFFLECDAACVDDVEKHLKMYRVRRKIDISKGEFAVWAIFAPEFEKDSDFKVEISEKCILSPDPRQSNLGYRAVVPEDTNLGNNSIDNTKVSYKMHRYRLGIAEGIEELSVGKSFPLEMNCDYLNGVSFNKGCYIGQELTARTYHTGVVRKRLMPLVFASPPENICVEDPIMESSSLKPATVGKLRGVFVDVGLGLMRVKETLAATSLTISNIPLKCSKPFWWPLTSEEYELKKHM